MPAALIPLAVENSTSTLRLIVDSSERPPTGYSVQIGAGPEAPVIGWRSFGTGLNRVWFANHRVPLSDGETAVLRDAKGATMARASLPPLPSADHLTLIVGSCLAKGQRHQVVESLYDHVTSRLTHRADLNVWLGDQVYVDAPAFRDISLHDPWAWVLDRYRSAWGLTPGSAERGLRHAMVHTANLYIPDDHEFWNGYPAPSLTLPFHTAKRLVRQAVRFAQPNRPLVHPAAQGPLGHAAGAAYCVFQTNREFGAFDESVSPEGLQVVERDGSLLVLVDTRWRRTIRKTGDGLFLKAEATFMSAQDLDRLVGLLTSDSRLVCLALSRPIIGFLPHRGRFRPKIEYAAEDYAEQYTQLWAALSARSDKGWPTLLLGGDVHTVAVKTALDRHLLEVTSSPLAQLPDVDERSLYSRLQRVGRRIKIAARAVHGRWSGREPLPTGPDLYPIIKDGSWDGTVGQGHVDFQEDRKPAAALAGLCIRSTGAGRFEVDIHTVFDRELNGTAGPERVSWDLLYGWDGTEWVFSG